MKTKTRLGLKSKFPRPLWKALSAVYRKLLRLRYKIPEALNSGKMTLYCPCCGNNYKRFVAGDYSEFADYYDLSLFKDVRQDVICPYCGSLPRHRILSSWGEQNIDSFKSKDILYFAPERSMTTWMRRHKISCTTADLFNDEADLQIDIQKTGLESGSYDVVICNHVLEHVDDVMTALYEIKRILRPGGMLICSFPMSTRDEKVFEDKNVVKEEDRLRVYGQSDHVRLFGMKADLILTDAGFKVSMIDGSDYPDKILPITGPCRYDLNRLFLCLKEAEG